MRLGKTLKKRTLFCFARRARRPFEVHFQISDIHIRTSTDTVVRKSKHWLAHYVDFDNRQLILAGDRKIDF